VPPRVQVLARQPEAPAPVQALRRPGRDLPAEQAGERNSARDVNQT
jgi:hypothetical protein